MKLRIKGNSIRFRLTKSEVDYFGDVGYLEEKTEFANTTLVYAIQNKLYGDELSVEFSENKIIVSIPQHITYEWVNSNHVSLQNEVETGYAKTLAVLIEKDFKCLDETGEDQSDNYPNPLAEK